MALVQNNFWKNMININAQTESVSVAFLETFFVRVRREMLPDMKRSSSGTL
jgi:hypothetical protein